MRSNYAVLPANPNQNQNKNTNVCKSVGLGAMSLVLLAGAICSGMQIKGSWDNSIDSINSDQSSFGDQVKAVMTVVGWVTLTATSSIGSLVSGYKAFSLFQNKPPVQEVPQQSQSNQPNPAMEP